MSGFFLKIVTPDGLKYEGMAEAVILRTVTGDMGILPGHISCVAPLGMGQAAVVTGGKKRYAACIGGMVSVIGAEVRIVATTFEWADEIDVERARASARRARQVLEDKRSEAADARLAEARLKRALVRQNAARQR